ncbi:unnamed protein product [Heterosigma akashiwo]|mmetsp:Transcript_10473/g.16942  ORF Transcript_10473/g.16942 Transcript_10473/m.16942 type:complete len:80 (+) Transcript_10473:218-457(+)
MGSSATGMLLLHLCLKGRNARKLERKRAKPRALKRGERRKNNVTASSSHQLHIMESEFCQQQMLHDIQQMAYLAKNENA